MRFGRIMILAAATGMGMPCAAQYPTVRGYVFSRSDTTPVFNAHLGFKTPGFIARFNPTSTYMVVTDSSGFFEVPGMPLGPKDIRVRGTCFLTQERTHAIRAGREQVLDTLWLEPDLEVCREELWIVGQLLAGEDSIPINDVRVSVANEAYGSGGYDPVLQVRTGQDGRFRLRVPRQGDVELRFNIACREGRRMQLAVNGVVDVDTVWLDRSFDTLYSDHGVLPCWGGR